MDEREVKYVKARCSPVSGIVCTHSSRNAGLWFSRGRARSNLKMLQGPCRSHPCTSGEISSYLLSFSDRTCFILCETDLLKNCWFPLSLALFPQLSSASDPCCCSGQHQQWELSEKMRKKKDKICFL